MKNKLYKIRSVPRNASTSQEIISAGGGLGNSHERLATIAQGNERERDSQFSQLVNMFQTFMKTSESKEKHFPKSYQVEARDREVLIPLPQIINNKISQSELKTWTTEVVKTVCSSAFNYFFKKEVSYEQAKIYCSENIFKNMVILSSKYSLSAAQIELIDVHIKKGVLTYLGAKYPLTDSNQINKKLEAAVHEVDNIEALSNNYFFKSSIIFQYRDSGNYNDLIMRMLNDLMGIIDEQNQDEVSNYQEFQEFMSTIFQRVEDEDWMRKHDKETALSHLKLSHQRSDISSLEMEQINRTDAEGLKEKIKKQSEDKEKYKSKVKEYTHYLIGRKIPEHTPAYSQIQIDNGNISIKSPTILRILTKWCGELHEKYGNSYFSNRSESVKVQRGDNVNSLLAWMRKNLDSKLQEELKDINQSMANLFKNNYEMQAKIFQHELNIKGDEYIDHFEKISGKLSCKVVKNLHTYIIYYLNRLIHGLMKASKQFLEENGIFSYNLWPSPPNLLTFKIGDLMRCKCSSKQKEILRIYKELHRISRDNPEKLKIIRVKNRLRTGTNDILMNIRFNDKITCEIQLGIKSKTSDFNKCSNLFHHYLYELQRSAFGPLTELCSIWNSLDRRTDIYRDLIDQEQFTAASLAPSEHTCTKLKKRFQMLPFDKPFICNHCNRMYYHNSYLRQHVKCSLCAYLLCANCRLNSESQEELKNTLINNPQVREACKGRIHENQDIPSFGVCIFTESIQPNHELFTLVTHQKTKYLLAKRDGVYYEVYKINSKKMMRKFKKKFIIFQVYSSPKFQMITEVEAFNKYILPLVMQHNFKKEKQSINLMELHLTTEECREILSVGSKSQKQTVKNLFLVDNKLQGIPLSGEDFPNIQWLTLSRNYIKSFEGIQSLRHLKNIILVDCQFTQFPQQLYQCESLQHLSLPNNSITSIDDRIANLTKLQTLQLSSNAFTSLPESLFNCINLKALKMDGNQLTQISASIIKLQKLEMLIYSSNILTFLPENIGDLPNLREIYVDKNGGLDSLPLSLGKLKNIEMFDISSTPIQEIPAPQFGWPKLRLFNIQSTFIKSLTSAHLSSDKLQTLITNFVSVQYPVDGNYKNLKNLEAKGINFSSLSASLSKMTNLHSLNLQASIFQNVPQFTSLINLESLNISNCNLTQLPSLSGLRKLRKLNISINPEIRLFDPAKVQLPLLEEFICTNCNISQLPSCMLKWQRLIKLDIKNNVLTSLFDEQTETKVANEKLGWPKLKYAYLSSNQLTVFPEAILNSPKIADLHLSSNQITCIPPSIKNLTQLYQIQMNYNQVQVLPPEFGELLNIVSAYLSCCKYKKVPLFIKDMPKLKTFYMDYNEITEVECAEWIMNVEDMQLGNMKQLVQTLIDAKENAAPPQAVNEEKAEEDYPPEIQDNQNLEGDLEIDHSP